MKTSVCVLTLLFAWAAIGSTEAQISGTVSSVKGKSPEEGVQVFINNTAIATLTNKEGKFSLENIPEGYWEIILFKKGFDLYRSLIKIQRGKALGLNLSITESAKRKSVTPRSVDLDTYNSMLSGRKATAITAKDISVSRIGDSLAATVDHPIKIENEDIGVMVYCYIVNMYRSDYQKVPVRFEYMIPKDPLESIRWEKNRTALYKGTLSHWLTSLQANTLVAEGFMMRREDGTSVDRQEIVSPSGADNSRLDMPQPVHVSFRKSDGTELTTTLSTNGPVLAHAGGTMLNPKLLTVDGKMGWQYPDMRIPNDYVPINGDVDQLLEEGLRPCFEKIYVHTDKPYYYPGEAIWLKVYLNYYSKALSDLLSRVTYVELISPDKKVIQRKAFQIDNGSAWGEFNLNDSLKRGLYYLRSYTNLARNFGKEAIFIKPFHIVDIKDKVVPLPGDLTSPVNDRVAITTGKSEYKPRERVAVDLVVKDTNGNPTGANISVSVTDAVQVVPIKEYTSIELAAIDASQIGMPGDTWYAPEVGISFSGVFVGDKGKPEKGATVGFTQMKSGTVMMTETDEFGKFTLAGLQHYDTVTYFFTSDLAGKIPYGEIIPDAPDIPAIDLPIVEYPIDVISTSAVQRLVSEYEAPKEVRVLQEVEIRGNRIEVAPVSYIDRPFGRGDHIIQNKDFNPAHENILLAMQGRIPGLFISYTGSSWRVVNQRGINSFSGGNGTPLIIVDNVILVGDAVNTVLAHLHPANIESIEVRTRPSAIFGSRGSQGAIMVYTKQGVSLSADPNYKEVKIPGFSFSHPFISPNYDDPSTDKSRADYRSIIYWQPQLDVNPANGAAAFSFFAADLPGKYRIVVEGFNTSGEPIHAEHYVTVDIR